MKTKKKPHLRLVGRPASRPRATPPDLKQRTVHASSSEKRESFFTCAKFFKGLGMVVQGLATMGAFDRVFEIIHEEGVKAGRIPPTDAELARWEDDGGAV